MNYELIRIGTNHYNYCEDFAVNCELGNNRVLYAVMDGCSNGNESHFASTLVAKILRKISKEIYYSRINYNLKELQKFIIESLFSELRKTQITLMLDTYELLTTVIILILDRSDYSAETIIVGDGLVCCNGKYFEFDQSNTPDYLAYHLSENFESWYQLQTQKISFSNVKDISISTDGIFSFINAKNNTPANESEIIEFLLIDALDYNQNGMLKKLNYLMIDKGMYHYDDIGIVRIVL